MKNKITKTIGILTFIALFLFCFPSTPARAYTPDAFRELSDPGFISSKSLSGSVDGSYPTNLLPLEVRRMQIDPYNLDGAFGIRDLAYNMRISLDRGGDVIALGGYLSPNIRVYRKTLSRGFARAPGVRSDLRIEPDSTFVEVELQSKVEFHYNAEGLLEEIRDKNGNSISITRDGQGKVTSVTDNSARTITFNYTNNQITKAIFSAGGFIDYEYVTTGCLPCGEGEERTQLSKITELSGNVVDYIYDDSGLLVSKSDSILGTINFNISGLNAQIRNSDSEILVDVSIDSEITGGTNRSALGLERTTSSDFRGLVISETNSRGLSITTKHDADQNPILRTTNTDTIYFRWGEGGEILLLVRSTGETRTYEYDSALLLTKVTYATGDSEVFNYDTVGNIERQILPNGGEINLLYDELGNITEITDPDGVKILYEYNDMGFITKKSNCASGCGTARYFSYNARGRVIGISNNEDTIIFVRDVIGREVERQYPGGGKKFTEWSPSGPVKIWKNGVAPDTISYEYSNGVLVAVTDALGNRQEFNFIAGAYRNSFKNRLGDITGYSYDSAGNLAGVNWPTNPLGSPTRSYSYDTNNSLIKHVRETGDVLEYQYDPLGRMETKTVNSVDLVEFTRDARGDIIGSEDELGTMSLSRDALGRTTRIEYQNGSAIDWEYSPAGRLIKVDAGGSNISDITYGSEGRVSKIGTEAGDIDYGYDSVGRVDSMTYPNGVEAIFTYNQIDAQTKIEYRNIGGSNGDTIVFSIGRDSVGTITHIHRSDLAETMNLIYSAREEIIGANIVRASDTLLYRYAYDSAGNRIRYILSSSAGTSDTVKYDYDPGNILDTGSVNYSYNLAGEVTAIGNRPITYDAEGRLSTDSTPEGTIAYNYDANGNRVRSTLNGSDTWRLWDPFRNEIADADEDGNISEFRYFVPGRIDGLLGFTRGSNTYFTLRDPQGNVALVVDENANLVAQYAYEPFNIRNEDSTDSIVNPFKFAHRRQEKTGEIYVRARSLDADIGRFMQRDPLFTGNSRVPFSWHGFMYADNDGINKWDPLGLICKSKNKTNEYPFDVPTGNSKKSYETKGNDCYLVEIEEVESWMFEVNVTYWESNGAGEGPAEVCPPSMINWTDFFKTGFPKDGKKTEIPVYGSDAEIGCGTLPNDDIVMPDVPTPVWIP